eukprot:GILK01002959.1.p1 GENE.GILK01002959.1~~GILK01002959.1.p1  ORF type:complete len:391 (-),score=59.54 GILK01002959.1:179-1351(-)
MGQTLGRILTKACTNAQVRILMCGLDAAGKTTILYQLKLGEIVTTIPTIGFNVETVHHKNIDFTIWDVGGRGKLRALLRHYYAGTHAVIFVVDSNDRDRISEARDELHRQASEAELAGTILLVLSNKRDLPNSLSREEVSAGLDMHSLHHRAALFEICAITGDGLEPAMQWLSRELSVMLAADVAIGNKQRLPELIQQRTATEEANFEELITKQFDIDRYWGHIFADLSHEEFLRQFEASSLPTLPHAAKIRMMWLYLSRISDRTQGRKQAVSAILDGLQRHYHSRGQVFHLTHSYFWLQLVDLAIHNPAQLSNESAEDAHGNPEADGLSDFRHFVEGNSFVLNEDLVMDYYSIKLIFHQPASATEFVLPDLKPLPSVLSFNRRAMAATV